MKLGDILLLFLIYFESGSRFNVSVFFQWYNAICKARTEYDKYSNILCVRSFDTRNYALNCTGVQLYTYIHMCVQWGIFEYVFVDGTK